MQYITPEMVSTRNFQDILTRLANGNLISLFAVDEVKLLIQHLTYFRIGTLHQQMGARL